MEHYPAYDWSRALDEASVVIAALFLRIPGIHFKRAWPVAQVTAMLGNVNGGKAKSGGSTPAWKLFHAREFLPGYAWPQDMERPQVLTPHHCAALVQALEAGQLQGASWVLQMLTVDDTLERIQAVAAEYSGAEAGDPEESGE